MRDAIGQLDSLEAGESSTLDSIHRAPRLSSLNMRRMQASTAGGSWLDWPTELRASCHTKDSGKWYRNVYGRMEWERPAPTITTGCFGYGRGRFGHPTQDRAISLREAAMLQDFPETYDFVAEGEPVHFNRVGRHIGNAVPVGLGEAIARKVHSHIKEIA